ncbi:MAG: exosortase-associated EpsI family protein [Pirellulales bacterium]
MTRYLPAILGVLLIVVLTVPQVLMSDRFADSNRIAEEQAELLQKVPDKFGDWIGEDMKVTEEVRRTAGATGAISRLYRNTRTGDQVNLWLIVGHARPVSAHTPNICYAGSGFVQRAPENSLHAFAFPGQDEAPFWTNTFIKEDTTGRQLVRVFWSWFNPLDEAANNGEVHWQAAKNPRWQFGNTRALYKMYFTSVMRDPKETTDESPCSRFARDFLPVVDTVLAQVEGKSVSEAPAAAEDPSAAEQPAAEKPDESETTG